MPIFKGQWKDAAGVDFMPDCYATDDEFGGPRCKLRPHLTKRRTKPSDFPLMADFGEVARFFSEHLDATDRLGWCAPVTDYTNRRNEPGVERGHLRCMNHNLPLLHAGRELHLKLADRNHYIFRSINLLEIDTDFDKLRMSFSYAQSPPQRDNGTLHVHQVPPAHIDSDQAWRYAYYLESHDCSTDKWWPDVETDEFWIEMAYHVEPGDVAQFYFRYSRIYSHDAAFPMMVGMTTSFIPYFYKITA